MPATEEKLEIGLEGVTMANEGFLYVKNLGGTNTTATEYVTIGSNGSCSAGGHTDQATCEGDSKTWTAGSHTMKIIVGESVVFRAGVSVLSVKASSNATQVEIISVEN